MDESTPPLILEKPNPRIQRDAKFYAMMGNTLDGHLSYRRASKFAYFPPVRDASWYPTNAERFRDVVVPDIMSTHWQHKILTLNPIELQPFATKLRVNNDDLIEHLTDIHTWPPFMIVSDRAKMIMEDIEPGFAYFLPVEMFNQANEPIDRSFHWCIVKNRVYFDDFSRENHQQVCHFLDHLVLEE